MPEPLTFFATLFFAAGPAFLAVTFLLAAEGIGVDFFVALFLAAALFAVIFFAATFRVAFFAAFAFLATADALRAALVATSATGDAPSSSIRNLVQSLTFARHAGARPFRSTANRCERRT
ncbi:hypothetical protein [Caballeronia sp. dw_276]|uniref:hypothetical protein n=1 Tax=Caballeronia sp. dw_276 TaxID=2719795 RepID=UPI001BD452B2|nr:hypothetical protein [Caballeronia sp. dw_276]